MFMIYFLTIGYRITFKVSSFEISCAGQDMAPVCELHYNSQ